MGVAIVTPDLESAPRRPGRVRTNLLPYALIGPSVEIIAGILAFPLGMLVWLSLQRYGLRELIAHAGEWVGAANYQRIDLDPPVHPVSARSPLLTLPWLPLTVTLRQLSQLCLPEAR